MYALNTLIGGGLLVVALNTGLRVALPAPRDAPPVDLVSVAYDPGDDVVTYRRIVQAEDAVAAPFATYIFVEEGGPEVTECRGAGMGNYDPAEPTTQFFSLSEFTGQDQCRSVLSPGTRYEIVTTVTPLGRAPDEIRSNVFTVSE